METKKKATSGKSPTQLPGGIKRLWNWLFELHNQENDRLYAYRQVVMIICLGFLPPWFTLLGERLMLVPLLVISFIIAISLFARRDFRSKMSEMVQHPAIIVLFLLIVYTGFHAVFYLYSHPSTMEERLFQKPLLLFVGLILLAYVWSVPSETYKKHIPFILEAGLYLGIGLLSLQLIFNFTLQQMGLREFYAGYGVYSSLIRRATECFAILVFLLAIPVIRAQTMKFITVIAVLYFWSIYGVGVSEGDHKIYMYYVRSETAQFGIPIAFAVFWISRHFPAAMTHMLFSATALILAAAPWIFQAWFALAPSLHLPLAKKFLVRAEIWDGTARQALQSPWIGHGIDSLRHLQNLDLHQVVFKGDQAWHPHNIFLQIWVDLGMIGVGLWLALLYLSWRWVTRSNLPVRPAILGCLTMLLLTAMVTHSMWQSWWIALCFITVALIHILEQSSTQISNN